LASSDDQGVLLKSIELDVAGAALEGKREHDAALGFLLLAQPVDVTAVFPIRNIGGVDIANAVFGEFEGDFLVGLTAAEHLVDFFAQIERKPGDLSGPGAER